ncbi:MAG: bacteriohemerythrin [Fibrobacterota bacterium]
MDKIQWNSSFSVGVRLFDQQHQRIIDLINRLIDFHNTGVGSEGISQILEEMSAYAEEHFLLEEKALLKHDYPEFSQHKTEHEAFIKKNVHFCMKAMIDSSAVSEDMLVFMKRWWTHHILESDMKYRSFLTDQNVS